MNRAEHYSTLDWQCPDCGSWQPVVSYESRCITCGTRQAEASIALVSRTGQLAGSFSLVTLRYSY